MAARRPTISHPADSLASDPRGRQDLFARIDARILPFLFCCYVMAYLDRVNVSFVRADMANDLGLDDLAFGVGAGLFFFGYALFEVPSNLLLARIGARLTFARILILWGLCSAATALVRDAHQFWAVRILLGVFEAGFAPGMIYYLTQWYPQHRNGRVLALVMIAAPLGSALGAPLSVALMENLAGLGGFAGWQWLFLVEGLPCVLLGLMALRVVVDRPADAAWLSPAEKQAVERAIAAEARPGANATFGQALRDPRIHGLAASYFCLITGIYCIGFWLPTLFGQFGFARHVLGWAIAVPYVAAALAMLASALLAERLGRPAGLCILLALTAALAMLGVGLFAPGQAAAVVLASLSCAALWASYTLFWVLPRTYLEGRAAAGGIAYINSVGLLGGFAGPALAGLVSERSGTLGLAFAVIALIVAAAVAPLAMLGLGGKAARS